MKENFDDFLAKIEAQLPDLVSPENLLELGVGSNHTMLFRLRQKGEIPFLKLSNARILYLKKDVIDWLRNSYTEEDCLKVSVK